MLDRLHTMKVFITVVDEGGFTAAARRLSMTVPHVTRHVAALEEELGTRLLQRTTRRVTLTAAGARYAERVRDILEAVNIASAEVQSTASALSGVLRVVAAPSLIDALIAPLAAPFRQRYPGILLDVFVDADPVPDLSRYDLGFLQVPEGFDASIVARTLSTSESVLCASPDYLARHGTPLKPEDLAQHLCVLRRFDGLHRSQFMLWQQGQRISDASARTVQVSAGITINQTASILQMVLDGAGIAPFTLDSARPFLEQGMLERVLPQWITGRYSLLAAMPSRKHLPERAKVFLDFVCDAFQAKQIDRC